MYAADFAEGLPVLALSEMRAAIHSLLDARDPDIWMLFGTLPFFACNGNEEDLGAAAQTSERAQRDRSQ